MPSADFVPSGHGERGSFVETSGYFTDPPANGASLPEWTEGAPYEPPTVPVQDEQLPGGISYASYSPLDGPSPFTDTPSFDGAQALTPINEVAGFAPADTVPTFVPSALDTAAEAAAQAYAPVPAAGPSSALPPLMAPPAPPGPPD